MERLVDGNETLAAQENTLALVENAGPYFLTNLVNTESSNNKAKFINAPLGQDIPELVIIELEPGTDPSPDHDGKALVFSSTAFVSGEVKPIACYR